MLPQCVTFSLHLINRLLYSVATPMCNGLARMSKVRNHGMRWVMLRLNSNLSNNNNSNKETGVEKLLISEEINNNNILVKFKANSKVGEDNKAGADNNKANNKDGAVNNSKVDGEVNNNKGGVSSKEDGVDNSNNNREAGEVNSKAQITGDSKDGDNLYDLHCAN